VTEDVLRRCIGELRRAFDDDARNPHFIETVSNRGYRLLAPASAFAAARALPESPVTDSVVVLPSINMSADSENDFVVSPALLLKGSRAAHGKRHALRAMVTARDQIDTLRP
jgi:DNA-binding winged helix-turn-helix (wHTH) protein